MDKKTILAFVVIGIVIILMPYYQQWLNPQDASEAEQQQVQTTVQQPETVQPTPPPEYVRPEVSIENRELSVDSKEVVIKNDKFAMRLSNLGGGTVRDYEFNKYENEEGGNLHLLPVDADANLNVEYTNLYQDPSNLDLIAFDCAQLDNYRDGDTLWVDNTVTLTYTTLTQDGIKVEKTFTFYPDRYDFGLDVALADYMQKMAGLKYSLKWVDGFAITEKNAADDIMYSGVYAQRPESQKWRRHNSEHGWQDQLAGIQIQIFYRFYRTGRKRWHKIGACSIKRQNISRFYCNY